MNALSLIPTPPGDNGIIVAKIVTGYSRIT